MGKSIKSVFAVGEVTILKQDTAQTKLMHTVVKAGLQEPSEAEVAQDINSIGGDTLRMQPYNEYEIDLCGCNNIEIVIKDLINKQLGTSKDVEFQLVFEE